MLKDKLPAYLVLLASIAALLIPVIRIENGILQDTHGVLTYPLDGAFLHMTIARNLAFNQVWGITQYSFQPSAVSPLYTILLAVVFFITGAHTIIPLLVNLATAIYCLFFMQQWLIRQGMRLSEQLLILLMVVACTPLPLLVISGTGQTLQLLLGFLFISSFLEARSTGRFPRKVYLFGLLVLLNVNYFPPFSASELAWLIGCVLIILSPWMLKYRRRWLLPVLVLALPLLIRSVAAFGTIRQSFTGMYEQQYQVAQFVHRYYYRRSMAINEMGAISWYSEGRKLALNGKWLSQVADSLCHQKFIQIAILSAPAPTLPANWNKVASWQIQNRSATATGDSVSFYGIDSANTAILRRNLLDYQESLPPGVIVRFF